MENLNNNHEVYRSVDQVSHNYINSFPPGYRFVPRDDELIEFYLHNKLHNQPLPHNCIQEVDIYRFSPDQLQAIYHGDDEDGKLYFFTPRQRKYPKGQRPNRAAGDGYWKASGKDDKIFRYNTEEFVGYRRKLIFSRGKAIKCADREKTDWVMHEYTIDKEPSHVRMDVDDMTLDDCVLVAIYKKKPKQEKKKKRKQKTTEKEEGITTPDSTTSEDLSDDHVSANEEGQDEGTIIHPHTNNAQQMRGELRDELRDDHVSTKHDETIIHPHTNNTQQMIQNSYHRGELIQNSYQPPICEGLYQPPPSPSPLHPVGNAGHIIMDNEYSFQDSLVIHPEISQNQSLPNNQQNMYFENFQWPLAAIDPSPLPVGMYYNSFPAVGSELSNLDQYHNYNNSFDIQTHHILHSPNHFPNFLS